MNWVQGYLNGKFCLLLPYYSLPDIPADRIGGPSLVDYIYLFMIIIYI